MLEQVNEREKAEVKKVLIEVCCAKNSRLTSHSRDRGGEGIRLYLPKHNVARDYTIEAAKRVIKILEDEGFTVKIRISIPCSPWCSWQRVNLCVIEGFESTLNQKREESRKLMDKVTKLVEDTKCESYFEWPKRIDGWREPKIENLMESMPHYTTFDGCAYGLKISEGKAMRKIWKVASTHERIK